MGFKFRSPRTYVYEKTIHTKLFHTCENSASLKQQLLTTKQEKQHHDIKHQP